MKKILSALSAFLSLAVVSNGASIVAQAATYNGFSDQAGAELALGNQIRIGTFSLADSEILLDAQSPAGLLLLSQNFIQFGVAHIGDNGLPTGYFQSNSIVANTDSLGLANAQVYLWVFKTATNIDPNGTFSNVIGDGVFWLDKTAAGGTGWRFRPQAEIPNSTLVDITDLTTNQGGGSNTLRAGAHLAAGTFPAANSTAVAGARDFGLVAVVPEPASLAILAVGLLAVSQRRRRNS